jgi:hypothetical protein
VCSVRPTGLPQTTTGGEEVSEGRDPRVWVLDRLRGYLWHGQVSHVRHITPSVVLDPEAALAHPGDGLARQRLSAVEVRRTSIERDRQGEQISTGVVESTGHQGAQADGNAVATGRTSTGRVSAAADPDPGV